MYQRAAIFISVRSIADIQDEADSPAHCHVSQEEEKLEFAPLVSRLALLRETLEGLDITDIRELGLEHLVNY